MSAHPTSREPMPATRARLVLVACVLASSLVGVDGLMTTVALPVISDDLGAGLSAQQWTIAGFLLTVGSLLLVGGAVGDVYGRLRVLLVGTAGYGLAALLSALAPNATVLVAGRLLQGAAAAFLLPSILAVMTTTFDGARRAKAIATWSAWSGLSVVVGPAVGGVLAEALSWRAVYLVEIPLAALVLVLIARVPADTTATTGGRVDVLGAVLAVPTVGGPAFFLIQGTQLGWSHPVVLGALVLGLTSGGVLVWWERRVDQPLVPLTLFGVRTFTMLNVVTFLLYGALIACGTYTVIFVQDGLGYHPAIAGVVGAVPVMVLFVLSGRFGALADRFGHRPFIGGGAIVAGLGMLLLLRADADANLYTVVIPSVLVHGLGLAMLVAPLTSGVMSAVGEDRAGAASGVNNAVARTGSMVAIAAVGAIVSAQFSASVDDGLAGRKLTPEQRHAVEQARQRPLSDEPAGGLGARERAELRPVLASAAASAFHLGIGVTGGLALTAGALALAGSGRARRSRYDASGTVGCPITGIRGHVATDSA